LTVLSIVHRSRTAFSNGKSKRNAGSPVKLDVRFEMKQLGSVQIAGQFESSRDRQTFLKLF
jgi:hypothetical protein